MNDTTHPAAERPDPVREALRDLPELAPSSALTARLDALIDAHAATDDTPRRPRRAVGFALAASVALAVWVALPRLGQNLPTTEPVVSEATGNEAVAETEPQAADEPPTIDALMARSAYLESVLDAVPQRGRVQRVGTASTITALEDRVAVIDAQLTASGGAVDSSGRTALWRERVGLMSTLVSLHAQPATVVSL